jgi:O-antigen biosynthesis protein
MKYTQFNYHPYEAHMIVYNLVNPNTKVLDLGCATGYFARELTHKNCSVFGVDNDPEAIILARAFCTQTKRLDLETFTKKDLPKKYFDTILLIDVIEHVKNVENLLLTVHNFVKPGGNLILSTPNISHLSIRVNLLSGNFNRTETGIMDKTHVQFFTPQTLKELLINTGWQPKAIFASADFGQIPYAGRLLRHVPKSIQHAITSVTPALLGVQSIVVCI